jgi:diguanylate cyclase (GGDEF)-like protein
MRIRSAADFRVKLHSHHMPLKHPGLEDFPDSAYAQELRRGPANMRFEFSLEAAYRIAHLRRVRLRVRIWHSVNMVLAVLFTADRVRRTGMWNGISVAHVAALVPCALALGWLAWSRLYERLYLSFARVLVAVLGSLIAVFVVLALLNGEDEKLAALTAILFGTFFFAGLMLRQALVAASLTLIAFACTAYAAGLPLAWFLKSMVIMSLTTGIAAIVYRDVEQSYRRNFLDTGIMRELVSRDGLSGLMNRRAFDEHLLCVWRQAIRDQRPVALLMIDIDRFKGYNDKWGHQAGDFALQNVAKVIQGFARRPLDLAARFGGDEFAVILYDLAFSHAQYLAERLRESVQNLSHEAKTWTGPEITVSVGVGFSLPGGRCNSEGVVRLADEALYQAKAAGRNCIIAKGAETYTFLNTGALRKIEKPRTAEPAE